MIRRAMARVSRVSGMGVMNGRLLMGSGREVSSPPPVRSLSRCSFRIFRSDRVYFVCMVEDFKEANNGHA